MKIDKICFLGFCVSQHYFDLYAKKDKNPQIAAYKFESRLIRGLRMNGTEVDVYASFASSSFPKNNKIFFPSANNKKSEKKSKTMSSLNLPGLKLIYRFFQSFLNLYKWAKQAKGRTAICIYSAHTPYLMAAYLVKYFFKIPFFVIIPDLPIYMSVHCKRNFLIKLLKRIDSQIIDWLIQQSTGISVITDPMIRDNVAWQKLPYIVIEGICEKIMPSFSNEQKGNYLLYAGGLSKQYGVKMLVDSFIESNLKIELWLCGRGDLENYIQEISQKDSRVKYLGFLDSVSLSQIQTRSKAMIITRDPQAVYTRYSFPSKILEYMVAGVPILTTRLLGIPTKYFEYLIPIEKYTSACIIESLEHLLQSDEETLANLAIQGCQYVLETKNPLYVANKFLSFIEDVLKAKTNLRGVQ
jgi:glycosyltransferase involved in cell wall biosynthesis